MLSAPGMSAGPVVPIVSHESKAASGKIGRNAAFTGPMFEPNGAATWYAAGISSGAPGWP